MAHYVIFTKVVTLTLPFIRFSKKKVLHCRVSRSTSAAKKIRTIGQVVWPVEPSEDGQTDKQDKQTDRQTDRQTAVTNILCKNRRFCKSNESRSESGYFAKPLSFNCVINIYCDKSRSNVKGQRSKAKGQGHSQFSPSASNEKCTMGRVLLMIQYYYNSRKYVTLTFDMWPWLVSLTLTLMFDLEVDLV